MRSILVLLSLLVGGSSLAMAQTAGGSSGGSSAASGSAATGSSGYAGGTPGNAQGRAATGDPDASSVTQPPNSRDNAVDTPAAKDATKSLSNTETGILKK